MAATDFFTGFGYKWAQDGSIYNWDDTQYKQGWATIGSVPPSVEQFNALQQMSDEKANWLYGQLQAAATAKGVTLTSGDLEGLKKTLAAYTLNSSESDIGILSIATAAEAIARANDTKAITPLKLAYAAQMQKYNYAVATGTANAIVAALSPAPTVLTAGMSIRIKIAATNTGAATLNLNGLGATAINGLAGSALQSGELFANGLATFVYSGSVWILLSCQGGALQVSPATKSNQAANLGQFASNLGENGYQKLPSGLIIQWAVGSSDSAGGYNVYWPITFPNACLSAIPTFAGGVSNAGATRYGSINRLERTQGVFYANVAASGIAIGVIALGY